MNQEAKKIIDLLINNAQIVTVNNGLILNNSSIAISGNKIVDLGDSIELGAKYHRMLKE
ncbi:MAG: hypothetical protein L0Y48_04590 [Fusobacteria bacterium]|nr:hypothetical protein [Fusobacteriota bacterium]